MDEDSFLGGLWDNFGKDVASSAAQSASDFIKGHVSGVLTKNGPAPTGNLTAAQIAQGQTGQTAGAVIAPSGAASFLSAFSGPNAAKLIIPAVGVIGLIFVLKGRK